MLRKTAAVVWVALGLVFAGGCVVIAPSFERPLRTVVVEPSPRWIEWNRIALIDIDGFIASGDVGLLFTGVTVADVKERLRRAAKDDGVVAVVLRINSPGGEAAASDVIYREIQAFRRDSGKPVVAWLMGVAASGGYYVACAADRIVAAPSTITGSIGVIMKFYNVEGLFRKVGVSSEVIKSGEHKDIGSMTRPMTPEERAVLEGLNRALYERFVDAVRQGRPTMADADFARVADGRPLTAAEAREMHLVDQIGYLDEAIALAKEMAGVREADVIMYKPQGVVNANIYTAQSPGLLEKALDALAARQGPLFLYLWEPAP